MPYKEPKIEKIYYRIGEVAEMLGISQSNIRFWEAESGVVKPRKTGKGNRLYTKEDIGKLQQFQHLVKDRGMTLKGAKVKIRQNPEDVNDNLEIIRHLRSIRDQLAEIRDKLGKDDEA